MQKYNMLFTGEIEGENEKIVEFYWTKFKWFDICSSVCREFEGVKIKLVEMKAQQARILLCSQGKKRKKESNSGCSDARNDLEDKEWGKDTNNMLCHYLLTVQYSVRVVGMILTQENCNSLLFLSITGTITC